MNFSALFSGSRSWPFVDAKNPTWVIFSDLFAFDDWQDEGGETCRTARWLSEKD